MRPTHWGDEMTTIATQRADEATASGQGGDYMHDGQQDVLARDARIERRAGPETHYIYSDGSRIVEVNGAWDVALGECGCWVGGGHNEARHPEAE